MADRMYIAEVVITLADGRATRVYYDYTNAGSGYPFGQHEVVVQPAGSMTADVWRAGETREEAEGLLIEVVSEILAEVVKPK